MTHGLMDGLSFHASSNDVFAIGYYGETRYFRSMPQLARNYTACDRLLCRDPWANIFPNRLFLHAAQNGSPRR